MISFSDIFGHIIITDVSVANPWSVFSKEQIDLSKFNEDFCWRDIVFNDQALFLKNSTGSYKILFWSLENREQVLSQHLCEIRNFAHIHIPWQISVWLGLFKLFELLVMLRVIGVLLNVLHFQVKKFFQEDAFVINSQEEFLFELDGYRSFNLPGHHFKHFFQ